MHRRVTVVLLLAAAALIATAAGCGGDDDDGGDEPAALVTTAETADEAPETDPGIEATAGASEDDCAELAALGVSLQQALGGSPEDDLDEYSDFLDEFAERAPESVRDDFAIVAEAFAKLVDALEGVDVSSSQAPSPETMAKLQEVLGSVDQAAVAQASTNISTWVGQNCPS